MPSEIEGQAQPDLRRRVIVLGLVLVVETLILGVAFFALVRTVGNRSEEGIRLSEQQAKLTAEIRVKEQTIKDAVLWNKQLVSASQVLDKHVRWTRFFNLLESKTMPTVSYLSLSGDSELGTVTLDALAKSYRDVAEQIVIFRNEPSIMDVRTTSAAAKINEAGEVVGVAFNVVLKVDPSFWFKK